MSRGRTASRQRSRQAALQVLYAIDQQESAERAAHRLEEGDAVRGDAPAPDARTEAAFEAACANFELPEGARAFAKELVHGVVQHRAVVDRAIARHATHWRIERMAVVDRNILRLGVYELRYAGLPASVAIDEAVELARRFGAERSPAFVNGVLDAVARALADSGDEL